MRPGSLRFFRPAIAKPLARLYHTTFSEDLPDGLGTIRRLDHNLKPGQVLESYKKSCCKEIEDIVRQHPNHVTFLVIPTIMGVKKNTKEEVIRCTEESIKDFKSGRDFVSKETMNNTKPGHIAAYTPESFISHKRKLDNSTTEAIKSDIETAVENETHYRDATFVVTIPRKLLRDLDLVKAELGGYNVSANDGKHNCSTALLLLAEGTNPKAMNPAASMMEIINHFLKQLPEEAQLQADGTILRSKLDRNLEDFALDQLEARQASKQQAPEHNPGTAPTRSYRP